ncbi:hypothetical protein COCC4DRAFT_146470 [Bipolaris maydis ATCC 48331]|uniref:Uncharacterized protein n=2 Tax=Cochliobolus heterostrophus TaxID=5016 RepID=M2UDQ6_COCH5|nr:uncharacterized protein COCC4DRAFT_146470 [Bipolaris maydis ATCC 48331]EMD86027.1 hypothetical protein COCHEDRAFT_1228628 [Bipolaris maydis C5]KAJ5028197.1 hypothetical protein J3E73DRAFT_230279 [Bipolaris maydis]ENI02030.1 hypothetical protein COCC4DRAFT_146470 [Bipolaris maydis ATCC 48331]KAJ5062974.1 hypothetical protein J3E74DRAFT_448157 [Bipolaris maydis]KAJ6199244.1 hypothetical protein J3E72DRAFT_416022 [Bipolaris maydis]
MSTIKTENNEQSSCTILGPTHSLMSENREPSHNASSILANEVEDGRPCNRALSLGLPPPHIASNCAHNNYLRDARLADFFSPHSRGGQPPVYHHTMNGQEQNRSPSVHQHGHNTLQNTVDRMVPEIVNLKKNLNTFTQNANNFALIQSQLFNSLNTRLVKAEYERDRLRATLSQYQHQHQLGSRMNTPQAAHEFGSRMTTPKAAPESDGGASQFHDDGGEDAHMPSPVTPCKPPQDIEHYYSSPIQRNTSETPFGSKLTGTKNQKREQTKARKDLKIKVPGQTPIVGNLTAGVHHSTTTASNSTTTTALTSPLTPGRIGPPITHPLRATTIISKRKIHNLEKLLPASTALIPLMPLTDTEIIVYFFQSLARPIVSLRLYARNWGPSNICDTLNAHRAIEGGYLRNTASVKCTTAIKRGKEKFGEAWADDLRDVFAHADDIHATDLIQLTADERAVATDFKITDLSRELKMHPQAGVDGGVFTECVRWCVERRAGYTLANVHELALALRRGEEPVLVEESEGDEEDA